MRFEYLQFGVTSFGYSFANCITLWLFDVFF